MRRGCVLLATLMKMRDCALRIHFPFCALAKTLFFKKQSFKRAEKELAHTRRDDIVEQSGLNSSEVLDYRLF